MTPADQFTYAPPATSTPTIGGLDVAQGPTTGGTVVTISGSNFNNVSAVTFGTVAATQFLVSSSTSIVALAPAMANAGTVDISVTTDAGTSAASETDQFSFVGPAASGSSAPGAAAPSTPAITGLSLSSGSPAGGDTVTISGSNLTGVTAVMFGDVAAAAFFMNPDGTLNATSTDTETDSIQSTIATTDPTTGLQITFNLQDSSGDTITASDNGNGADNSTYATGPITPGIAPTGTSTDVKSGEGDASGHETTYDHINLIANARWADSLGDQSTSREVLTFDDSGSDTSTNDDTQTPDGTNTGDFSDISSANGRMTDYLTGTATNIDPTTGIKTTTTVNDLLGSSVTDAGDRTDSATTTANGGSTGNSGESDNGSETDGWNIQETTTQTNADGTPIGAPVINDQTGSDTQTSVDGVTTDEGIMVPAAAAGANAPVVISVFAAGDTSAHGSTAGGDAVVISGSGFTSDSQVAFDGVQAQSIVVISSTEIIAVSPAHCVGTVHVTVANADGASTTSSNDEFQFADDQPGNGGAGTTTPVGGGINITTGGTGTPKTTGLIVPDLDPSKVKEFVSIVKRAADLQKRENEVLAELADAMAKKAAFEHSVERTQGTNDEATWQDLVNQWAARAGELTQKLNALQTEGDALAFEYNYKQQFDNLVVTGYPKGLTDDATRGTPVTGMGLAGAVAAYQNSLTSISGKDGLEHADGPAEFVITMFGPGLIAKGGKWGVGTVAAGLAAILRSARTQIHHIATNKGAWGEKFADLFKIAGRTLSDPANLMDLPGHVGRHIDEYHQLVYERLKKAIGDKTGDEAWDAIKGVLDKLRTELLENPRLPYKDGGLR